jgi:hypothetical protein
MHERSLKVDGDQHREPHHVDAEMARDRRDQRQDNESDLEEIQEECQEEYRHVINTMKPTWPAGRNLKSDSIQRWPSRPRNTNMKKDAPSNKKMIPEQSMPVTSIAWRRFCPVSFRPANPRTNTATTPMAPPSVGVATPK